MEHATSESRFWFQSPRNRVNTSNLVMMDFFHFVHIWTFQSPRNRVNTSNTVENDDESKPNVTYVSIP